MKLFRADTWLTFFRALGQAEALPSGGKQLVTQESKDKWLKGNEDFENICYDLGLRTSVKTIQRITELLSGDDATYGQLGDLLREFMGRVEDEMESELFLYIGADEARYYQDWPTGWQAALEKFPSISTDVEEAGKCLALNRNTACVFHLMRVAEAALVTIAKRVGLESQLTGWEEAIKFIETNVSAKYDEMDARFKGDREFIAGIASHMRMVNLAWRRRVSHIERNYSEEEARRIYDETRALMQHISTKLAEEEELT